MRNDSCPIERFGRFRQRLRAAVTDLLEKKCELGVASLVGVIVSHVIVLFDFIEEKHEQAEPFEEGVIDAGIIRLRPVMTTVGATVLALFPLGLHGGPLWQPLCYAQIGGLTVATFITLMMVPVLFAIFVLDLKILKWETKTGTALASKSETHAG